MDNEIVFAHVHAIDTMLAMRNEKDAENRLPAERLLRHMRTHHDTDGVSKDGHMIVSNFMWDIHKNSRATIIVPDRTHSKIQTEEEATMSEEKGHEPGEQCFCGFDHKGLVTGYTDPVNTNPADDPDNGLHIKYRVFREPDTPAEHPVDIDAVWKTHDGLTAELDEFPFDRFLFVLVPDNDPHARVALAAYAASVMAEKPELAGDLLDVLGKWWER